MKLVLSGLNSLVVGGCSAALLAFLGVNLDKRPWWSWLIAACAFAVIWEFAKAGIANSVAKKMGLQENRPPCRNSSRDRRRLVHFELESSQQAIERLKEVRESNQ